ncbi:3-hydroxyacyl-CoA dehydrogenase family protein [Fulvivirga maritima]|uniref:3-hydroxyacyl-CoA dehydrogenase family protein n=1 Tax=Fulvivirga maritima TaxID=2904247 RepID=UPI001F2E0C52|nr:3-hydroxyacyl-CoA dehydrogenase family protein [Fulvivirga maritima]UII27846.1 3-hydroxyacyl-CoA dehydrogenase family protein [Fulvivirga maritima]
MDLLIIGNEENVNDVKSKFKNLHTYTHIDEVENPDLSDYDYVFDFQIDETPERFGVYAQEEKAIIFINTVKVSLTELAFIYGRPEGQVYGFAGIPGFLSRELMEVTSFDEARSEVLSACEKLGTDCQWVMDRVGMVTPRIIFMIINEAYYTVQEGTATKEDVDKGMKLGTNYPYGPFEWAEKIGLQNVYETLEALYEDTKEERYKICPMLKKEYMLAR